MIWLRMRLTSDMPNRIKSERWQCQQGSRICFGHTDRPSQLIENPGLIPGNPTEFRHEHQTIELGRAPPDWSEIGIRFVTHDFRAEKSIVLWESRSIGSMAGSNGLKGDASYRTFYGAVVVKSRVNVMWLPASRFRIAVTGGCGGRGTESRTTFYPCRDHHRGLEHPMLYA